MAVFVTVSKSSTFLCLLCVVIASVDRVSAKEDVEVVTNGSMAEMMQGEWMVEFYAPWCPACKQFESTWKEFGQWAQETEEVGVRVGKVDVTAETLLSGQFMVTHLPTVFHIIDGVVRIYSEQRTLVRLIEYVEEEQWREVDPIPWWRSPTAAHMRVIGLAFWLSEKAKEVQVLLEQDYHMPTYAVFILIALGTILIGLTLGGITVCCLEICMRMCSKKPTAPPQRIPRKDEPKEEEGEHQEEREEAVSDASEKVTQTRQEETKPANEQPRKRKRNKSKKQEGATEG